MIEARLKSLFNCFKSKLIALIQHKKFLFVTVLLLLLYYSSGKNVKNNNFDYLIFSQRWVPSACMEYIDTNSSSFYPRHCILPKNYDIWAIHGLWPTKNRTIGPFFCNNSMPFNINKLQAIKSDLMVNWPNIEEGKNITSLWQHEWEKHGTCAAQLEAFNSEIKYFNTTLNFFKMYNMNDFMKKINILPLLKNGINFSDLVRLVTNVFGKLPQIKCLNEVKNSEQYLCEIRLCLNKNLELMDCGMRKNIKIHHEEEFLEGLTNCRTDKKIFLPEKIDVQVDNSALFKNSKKVNYSDTYDKLSDILRLLWLLQWVSI